ncbi:MAG: ATP phosphoribosyltransferase regulatory subunit [Solirubrobacterales bacterium]|nr:ATP phosphoribosyltransferase regulatory subunit [Solirubrobacterales bacterium]
MIHPIPPGTRDVLPEEMAELRRLQSSLLGVFERFGFQEVRTPTIEYAEVLERGGGSGVEDAYRFFDDRGELLALRTDMTIPIARLVATRFGELEPPYRLSYLANAYRAVTPKRAELREFGQAGIELIGAAGADGTAEVVEVLGRTLDAVGLREARVGLGEADLWSCLLTDFGGDQALLAETTGLLARHDIVGIEAALAASELDRDRCESLLGMIQLRGGPQVIDQARGLGGSRFGECLDRLESTYHAIAARGGAERVRIDLGLMRELGYYSGTTIEVYDPSVGEIIGGGGRYDGLMRRFGADHAAAGFTLYLEPIHKAQIEQGLSGAGPPDA